MPIPKPKDGEDQNAYMGRCMHAIKDEFDSNEQRVAVCLSTFRKHGKAEADVLARLQAVAEKFAGGGNPNHDPATGRFTTGSGGGSGGEGGGGGNVGSGGSGRRSGGPSGRKIPKAFTREWFNYWARVSQAFGRIAHVLQSALPVVLSIIAAIRGIHEIRNVVKNNKKAASGTLDDLIQQIQDMSDEERSNTINEILDGLSPEDADRVVAALEEDKAFNPDQPRDRGGRWTSGGGASAAGSGRAMVPQFARYPGGGSHEDAMQHLSLALVAGVAIPVILTAMIARKGYYFVKNIINKYRNKEKQTSASDETVQSFADDISALPKDTQQELFDELLSELSDQDIQYVASELDKNKSENPFAAFRAAVERQRLTEKFNPNHDNRGRFSSGGGSGGGETSAGGGGSFFARGEKPFGGTTRLGAGAAYDESGKLVKGGFELWKGDNGKYWWRTPPTSQYGGPFDSALEALQHADTFSETQLPESILTNPGKPFKNPVGLPEFAGWAALRRIIVPSKGNGGVMETKDFALEVGDVTDKGYFSGYASTYDVDLGQDKVVQGAFTKSLGHRMPLMLWSHDPKSPIGVWNNVVEDSKGLNVEGRILIDQKIPEADKAYALLKAKAIRGLSIGYRVKDAEVEDGVRLLKELELPEISVVSMPMNQNARVASIKADEEFFKWAMFEDWAQRVRDGEMPPIKELEDLLREAGVPKSVAVQIASVGYAKTIRRSDSGERDEATTGALERLRAAVKAFS